MPMLGVHKASQNRQQAGWTRYTRLCWQALYLKDFSL